MQSVVRSIAAAACAAIAISSFQSAVQAQDPVKIAPGNYKVVLENENVRVLEVTAKAGEKIAMHSHPDYAVYAKSSGKVKFTYPDGKSKDVELKAGEATWSKAENHAAENTGTTEIKNLIVEFKKPAPAAPPTKMPDAEDQAKVSPAATKVLLDNERVRVLESRLKPGGKVPMHSHPAHVLYALVDGKVKMTVKGAAAVDRELKAGQAMFNPPVTHEAENAGNTESHSLLIELKDVGK